MKHDFRTYLHDIEAACESITAFTDGMTLSRYVLEPMVQAAVERKFIIIGEALMHLRNEFPEMADQITDLHKVIGFRNILVHGYDAIDPPTVWSAVTENLPVLQREIRHLL